MNKVTIMILIAGVLAAPQLQAGEAERKPAMELCTTETIDRPDAPYMNHGIWTLGTGTAAGNWWGYAGGAWERGP